MKKTILPLESLRGFAALSVAVYHLQIDSDFTNNLFVAHSYWMVDFFFVLSGFVIAYSSLDRLNSFANAVSFQLRRFWRLYPLHIFTLLLFLMIELLKLLAEQKLGLKPNSPAFGKNNFSAFISNLFVFQTFYPNYLSFNYPSWSISAEFYTYSLFAFAAIFLKKWLQIVAAILCASSWYFYYSGIDSNLVNGIESTQFRIFRCVFGFFMGVMIYGIYLRMRNTIMFHSSVTVIVLIMSIFGICYSKEIYDPLITLMFAIVIIVVIFTDEKTFVYRALSYSSFVYLGRISYSVYMIHAVLWWFVNQILGTILKYPRGNGTFKENIYFVPQEYGNMIVVFCVVLLILFSSITYYLVEDKFRNGVPTGWFIRA